MEGGTALFIQKFIQSPLQVGSLFPSSAALARKMTASLAWQNIELAAELGAGTGVITNEIMRCMEPGTKLHVFEKDLEMRKRLQKKYGPSADYHEDACEILKSIGKEEGALDVVLSGLPFANFDKSLQAQLVTEIYRSLRPGGVLVAFQYSTQMKKTFQATFTEVEISFEPRNFPPAFVYTCIK
ncbi:methyltransferase domain-containing protein [Fictibacillus nanhaiensis]|uniref:class I SAM-dependent methyltransferase n=1 Tax=Fictibacillus nanhaiensis TaxID=742169 RepID=UPI001C96DE09|nr:methyltransferase domain-containing protein [Fictibacillus nanhaiensis]MBY6036545.1 methyltransferase domain-containing protein [Fictibacillus nanhaiensis]